MSANQTKSSANSTHCAPCGSSRRKRTSASQHGTSASMPAAAADHRATRLGANTIHASATSHHSTASSSSASSASGVAAKRHAAHNSAATSATYTSRPAGAVSSMNEDHSQAPPSASTVNALTVAHAGSQNRIARNPSAPT